MTAVGLLLAGLSACKVESPKENRLPSLGVSEAARCYDAQEVRQAVELAGAELARDVLVLIDQTTSLPDDVAASVAEQIGSLSEPGTRITVGAFSSYTASAHSRIDYETVIEPSYPNDARDDAPMKQLRRLDQCLKDRQKAETERLDAAIAEAVSTIRADVTRSDVIANVKGFGSRLRESPADDKILILVSDLLENSSAMSFYGKGAMRKLDPGAELEKAAQNDLIADLKGVRVFVIGAGLLPPGTKSGRSLEELRALEGFWQSYLEESGAEAVKIGKPRLLSPIR